MRELFIGREKELNSLETAYQKKDFQMCILYGRRRIGKTTLINEFMKGKNHISFTAIQGSLSRNIDLFGKCVMDHFMPGMDGVHFTDLKDILSLISANLREDRLILSIDELPYLSGADSSFLSLLQSEIDNHWLKSRMFLILSGSSVSFMEQEVLSSKSPIYGRRTMQIDLQPFDYMDTAKFVPDYTEEQKAICYGVTGGVAKYISMFDPNKSMDDNIIEQFFSPSGFLYEEPHNLLTQEFRHASVYDDVISAIALGANKAVEIKDKTKLESASVHNALNHLIETRIIRKELCITDEKNNKKTLYALSDGMFRFWHMFIPRAIPMIEIGNGREYYMNHVKPKLHDFMGEIFEQMCRHYILLNAFSDGMPCTVFEVGRWFGTNPVKKEQTDIDVVALDTEKNCAILGECKFRNTPVDKEMLDSLKERDGLIDHKYKTISYFLFSLGGFTKWFDENTDDMVRTISIRDMYN